MKSWIFVIITSAYTFVASTVANDALSTQYIALARMDGIVNWEQVTFPANFTATSSSEVEVSYIDDDNVPQIIGSFQNLDLGGSPLLTVRAHGNSFYAQLNTGIAPSINDGYPGGCCVDKFREWTNNDENGDNESYVEWDLLNIVRDTLGSYAMTDENTGQPYIYANHMFDMVYNSDGSAMAMLDIVYREPDLEGALVDGFAMFDLKSGSMVPTADGDAWFSTYLKVGTRSTNHSDGIYNILYNCSGADCPEQFHQNGLTRFQTLDGTWVVAATYLQNAEAVLFKCPFTYKTSEGGGSILQRFGSPAGHQFGLSQTLTNVFEHVHNVYYQRYPDGAETMTMYVNTQVDDDEGAVFEFDLKLTPQPSYSSDSGSSDLDDTVFETNYLQSGVGFSNPSWGGARPIGKGVWLVGYHNVTVVDLTTSPSVQGTKVTAVDDDHSSPPPSDDDSQDNIYDPFTFLIA